MNWEEIAKRGIKIATAESCTGGLIGSAITSIPGSSRYYLGGVIAYDDSVKINVLNVPQVIIKNYGAVSEECARHMSEGIKELLRADVGIATTGIAGPGGGTPQKPVGLVYVGISIDTKIKIKKLQLSGTRKEIRKKTVEEALSMLFNKL